MVIKRCSWEILVPFLVIWTPCVGQSRDLATGPDRNFEKRIDTEAQLRALYSAVIRFHSEKNTWPATLSAACDPVPHQCLLVEEGEIPTDFWGSPVSYSPRGDGFELRSLGPDRTARTSDDLVISHPMDRIFARQLAGCYQPAQGWWTSRPTTIRLDTLPGRLYSLLGGYFLRTEFPRDPQRGSEWFPIGTDSVAIQWGEDNRVRTIRLKILGDTLAGATNFDDLEWRGALRLVKRNCER